MNIDSRGLIGTTIIHGSILMIFALIGMKMSVTFSNGQGLLINFGDSETGLGNEEPVLNEFVSVNFESKSKQDRAVKSIDNKQILTQNFEEAPSLITPVKPKKKVIEKKKEKSAPVIETAEKKNEVPKIDLPKVNKQALYRGRKTGTTYTGSEGVAGGKGNQGSLSGSENATDHSLVGGGSGTGGGPSVSLSGRNSLSLPSPAYEYQKEGKVVVEIRVDRQGTVVSAIAGVKGSTTLDNYLCSVAKKAALASKFDINENAPNQQVGTITYIFKLK